MGTLLGIDVGGTFTDVVLYDDASGRTLVDKVSSTPAQPGAGVLAGIRKLRDVHGVDVERLAMFTHGSTVATNALLEHKLPRTALVVTEGFRDVLEIGDQRRSDPFDLTLAKPAPLIARRLVVEAGERLDRDGGVVRELTDAEIDRVVGELERLDVEAVAVCLLFSFMAPAHERRLGEALAQRLPQVAVALSSDVCPEIKEYARASTTSIAAALQPLVAGYLADMRAGLGQERVTAPLNIMQSSGGVMTAEEAASNAHRMILSGPAGGVIAAARLAERSGYRDQITFDMGGTSTDICLIRDGRPRLERESSFEGRPLKVPQVGIHTIGAGGGSLAHVDAGGGVHVGPESSGAQPGPACYGRGGTRPTTTDAHLVLGRLAPGRFLGGDMELDAEAARQAIATHVAAPLGVDVVEAAAGILDVADAVMARGVRVVSVNRGYDPRDFVLVAYGGAGGMHALSVARLTDVGGVVIPRATGAFSAYGLVNADLRQDLSQAVERALDELVPSELEATYETLEERAAARLREGDGPVAEISFQRTARVRYAWQDNAVEVPLREGALDASALAALAAAFHAEHDREFGHSNAADRTELVAIAVAAVGTLPRAGSGEAGDGAGPVAEAVGDGADAPQAPTPASTRDAYFRESGWAPTSVYERASLLPGQRAAGPAIVEEREATTIVPPGAGFTVDRDGNLLLSYGEEWL
jgi:N-methylhydantoinase A